MKTITLYVSDYDPEFRSENAEEVKRYDESFKLRRLAKAYVGTRFRDLGKRAAETRVKDIMDWVAFIEDKADCDAALAEFDRLNTATADDQPDPTDPADAPEPPAFDDPDLAPEFDDVGEEE